MAFASVFPKLHAVIGRSPEKVEYMFLYPDAIRSPLHTLQRPRLLNYFSGAILTEIAHEPAAGSRRRVSMIDRWDEFLVGRHTLSSLVKCLSILGAEFS